MQLACRQQQQPAAGEAQQAADDSEQQRQQPAAAEAQQAADGQQQQQGAAPVPDQQQKPIVVLVGATLDEPLVEHAVAQVRSRVARSLCAGLHSWLGCSGRTAALPTLLQLPRRGLGLAPGPAAGVALARHCHIFAWQPHQHVPLPGRAGLAGRPRDCAGGRPHAHPKRPPGKRHAPPAESCAGTAPPCSVMLCGHACASGLRCKDGRASPSLCLLARL